MLTVRLATAPHRTALNVKAEERLEEMYGHCNLLSTNR